MTGEDEKMEDPKPVKIKEKKRSYEDSSSDDDFIPAVVEQKPKFVPGLKIGGLSLSSVVGAGQKTTAEDAANMEMLMPKAAFPPA
jgi:hypothetical protein